MVVFFQDEFYNDYGWTPLIHAARNSYTDITKLILEKNVDLEVINAKDNDGYTPLMWALQQYQNTDIAKLLLETNAGPAILNAQEM